MHRQRIYENVAFFLIATHLIFDCPALAIDIAEFKKQFSIFNTIKTYYPQTVNQGFGQHFF